MKGGKTKIRSIWFHFGTLKTLNMCACVCVFTKFTQAVWSTNEFTWMHRHTAQSTSNNWNKRLQKVAHLQCTDVTLGITIFPQYKYLNCIVLPEPLEHDVIQVDELLLLLTRSWPTCSRAVSQRRTENAGYVLHLEDANIDQHPPHTIVMQIQWSEYKYRWRYS